MHRQASRPAGSGVAARVDGGEGVAARGRRLSVTLSAVSGAGGAPVSGISAAGLIGECGGSALPVHEQNFFWKLMGSFSPSSHPWLVAARDL